MKAPKPVDASTFGSPEMLALHVRLTRDRRELSRWLHEHVPADIARLLDDVIAGDLKLRTRSRPMPSRAEIERNFAMVMSELDNADSDSTRAARRLGLSLESRKRPTTARALIARLHGISPRMVKEIRYPQAGRVKRR